ncbi:MAG: hypothetical protein WC839_01980 [Candidatus Paceibacterota bacterium]
MDKKSKILFAIFFLVIIVSIVFTYYHYIILEDFVVFTDEEAFNEALLEE